MKKAGQTLAYPPIDWSSRESWIGVVFVRHGQGADGLAIDDGRPYQMGKPSASKPSRSRPASISFLSES